MNENCNHQWERTGEFHPTTNKIWFLTCIKCDAAGKEYTKDDGTIQSIEEMSIMLASDKLI